MSAAAPTTVTLISKEWFKLKSSQHKVANGEPRVQSTPFRWLYSMQALPVFPTQGAPRLIPPSQSGAALADLRNYAGEWGCRMAYRSKSE
jgi:hypothetical protein